MQVQNLRFLNLLMILLPPDKILMMIPETSK